VAWKQSRKNCKKQVVAKWAGLEAIKKKTARSGWLQKGLAWKQSRKKQQEAVSGLRKTKEFEKDRKSMAVEVPVPICLPGTKQTYKQTHTAWLSYFGRVG
jgi:hypothetical protein